MFLEITLKKDIHSDQSELERLVPDTISLYCKLGLKLYSVARRDEVIIINFYK